MDKAEVIIYQSDSETATIEVRIEDETVWLNRNQIAELFGVKRPAITKQLKLDMERFNAQYPHIYVKTFKQSHDRFLIIDQKTVYHIGPSFKDLGKKWFAFSKIKIDSLEMINKLK